MADGAKLCEIFLPQLQSHPSFILVFFGSHFQQLCWQWWQSLSNTANWRAFRTSLLGYLTCALYSPTCLWSVWMNLPPSLNKAPERVAVWKVLCVCVSCKLVHRPWGCFLTNWGQEIGTQANAWGPEIKCHSKWEFYLSETKRVKENIYGICTVVVRKNTEATCLSCLILFLYAPSGGSF